MRISTLCMLSVTLAAASLGGHQAGAASLTVRTPTPKVNVHLPPPKVTVQTSSPKVQLHDLNVTKKGDRSSPLRTAHQFDKNNGDKGKGGSTKGGLLKLDGIEGESQDSQHGKSIEIQSY